jgi:hypothetical protein
LGRCRKCGEAERSSEHDRGDGAFHDTAFSVLETLEGELPGKPPGPAGRIAQRRCSRSAALRATRVFPYHAISQHALWQGVFMA